MSWQAWCVLAVVLTIGAIAVAISSFESSEARLRLGAAAALATGAAAAYVVSAAIAWPA